MTQLRAIALSSLFMLAGIAGCSSYGYRGDVKGDDVGGVWHVVR